jgi:hypothetical protein
MVLLLYQDQVVLNFSNATFKESNEGGGPFPGIG